MRAIAIAAAVFLVAVSCGTGRGGSSLATVAPRYQYIWQAASRLAGGCARRDDPSSDVDGMLWLRAGPKPLVYYLDDRLQKPDVVSTLGDHFAVWGRFWPCRTPVAVYVRGRPMLTVLAPKPAQRRTITLGPFGNASWIVAPNGRFILFHGQSIRPAGGKAFTVRGLPSGWVIGSLSVSPRDPSLFLVNAHSDLHVPGGCRSTDEHGGVFLVTPRASTMLKGYSPCTVGSIVPVWSPDGRKMLWLLGAEGHSLFISDGRGGHLRRLIHHSVCGAIWSPDGKEVAWGYSCNRAHVLELATGVSRFVGEGELQAWSPDGKELALMRIHRPWYGPGSPAVKIVAVPVHGGPSRLLLKLPRTTS